MVTLERNLCLDTPWDFMMSQEHPSTPKQHNKVFIFMDFSMHPVIHRPMEPLDNGFSDSFSNWRKKSRWLLVGCYFHLTRATWTLSTELQCKRNIALWGVLGNTEFGGGEDGLRQPPDYTWLAKSNLSIPSYYFFSFSPLKLTLWVWFAVWASIQPQTVPPTLSWRWFFFPHISHHHLPWG